MLPLSLLNAAKGHPMLVELKNGDTYNGILVSCNMFMNLMLKDVICTSRVSLKPSCLSDWRFTDGTPAFDRRHPCFN